MLPEFILAIGAMALLMYGVFRPETQDEAETVGWLAILVMVAAGAAIVWYGDGTIRASSTAPLSMTRSPAS